MIAIKTVALVSGKDIDAEGRMVARTCHCAAAEEVHAQTAGILGVPTALCKFDDLVAVWTDTCANKQNSGSLDPGMLNCATFEAEELSKLTTTALLLKHLCQTEQV